MINDLRNNLESYAARWEQPNPVSALTEIPQRDVEERTLALFLSTLEKCTKVLKKRALVDAELAEFFEKRGIRSQTDLLNHFKNDPAQVAAYFISGKEAIPINPSEVYDWLVLHAHHLSGEMIEQVINACANFPGIKMDIEVTLGEYCYTLNRLKAGAKSQIFRMSQGHPCLIHSPAIFELIAKWIGSGALPNLKIMHEKDFKELQTLLDELVIGDEFGSAVLDENIRRYQLKYQGNVLLLKPVQPIVKHLHLYFRKSVHYAAVLEGEGDLFPLHFPNLKVLTIKPSTNFKPALLAGLNAKIEFVGEAYPKGVEGLSKNLINFVVQESKDCDLIPALTSLERVEVADVPFDKARLNTLKNLKRIKCSHAQMGDAQVQLLCKHNPQLEALELPLAVIGKEGFSALAALPNLKELCIGFTAIDITYPRNDNIHPRRFFKSFKLVNGFGMLENLTLNGGELLPDAITKLENLPNLRVLDIAKCKVNQAESLIPLLQSGQLKEAKIPCAGDDLIQFENYLHKHVNSETKITIN